MCAGVYGRGFECMCVDVIVHVGSCGIVHVGQCAPGEGDGDFAVESIMILKRSERNIENRVKIVMREFPLQWVVSGEE